MISQQHIIKKFSLELQTQGREHSYTLQRKCVKMVNEDLVPQIDHVLSKHFGENEMVRINKIEIDLGTMSAAELEKEFIAKCIAALTNKIKAIPQQTNQKEKSEAIEIIKEENILQQFFYFLSSGKMHWALYDVSFPAWQNEILKAIQLKTNFFKEEWSVFLLNDPPAIERLVLQFDDTFIAVLVALYHPEVINEYQSLTKLLTGLTQPGSNEVIRTQILAKVLFTLFGASNKIDSIAIEHSIATLVVKDSSAGNEKILLSIKDAILAITEKASIIFKSTPPSETGEEKQQQDNTINDNPIKTETEKYEEETADRSVYIKNAGIIILHPFLKNIFSATGLMRDENFKDEYSQQKAVHLLQYLANGEQEAPEYIMPLNKILCGLDEAEHIDRFIQLQEAEKTEADELLAAVITHWTMLKNTSAAALQETFFQRSGKLAFVETDGYWKLQVERKAVDILLDKIPWGISYIKLPWMKYALVTEW